MNFGTIIKTIFEIALIAFTLWAVFHEDKFAAFEQKIISNIRRRKLRVVIGNNYNRTNTPIRER